MEIKINFAIIKKATKIKYLVALAIILTILTTAAVAYYLYAYLYLSVYSSADELENTLASSQLINVHQIKKPLLEKELLGLEFKQKSCWNLK